VKTDVGRDSAEARPSAGARLLMLLIGGYRRFISPMTGPHCRFVPSCSAYALDAVRRIARCHPFHPGGLDPVPPSTRRGRLSRPEGVSS